MNLNKTLVRLLAALSTAVVLGSPAQANLVGRDISGHAVAGNAASAVFLYDSSLNVTWLRNANVNGAMTWIDATEWADKLVVGSVDNWRLPTTGTECYGFNCTSSEMGELWYSQLGNTAGSLTSTGDFLNMQSYAYWSGTEYAPLSDDAWVFNTDVGIQGAFYADDQFYALAVRPGDVLVGDTTPPPSNVPEPGTFALFGLAAAALGLSQRRRRASAANSVQ